MSSEKSSVEWIDVLPHSMFIFTKLIVFKYKYLNVMFQQRFLVFRCAYSVCKRLLEPSLILA